MKLIIIRHGETLWNQKHKVQGLSNQPLSKIGKHQAALLAKRFSAAHIDVIYTSKLRRTIQTGKAIVKLHPSVPIFSKKELNEMDWGRWEGSTFFQIEKNFPKEWEARKQDKFHFAPKGGESPFDLQKRLTPFLKKIVKKHENQTVLIIGHGGINRVIIGTILGWKKEKITSVMTKNTAVTILHIKKGKSRLHLFNCIKHLEKISRIY